MYGAQCPICRMGEPYGLCMYSWELQGLYAPMFKLSLWDIWLLSTECFINIRGHMQASPATAHLSSSGTHMCGLEHMCLEEELAPSVPLIELGLLELSPALKTLFHAGFGINTLEVSTGSEPDYLDVIDVPPISMFFMQMSTKWIAPYTIHTCRHTCRDA
ncbi:hypothetical protein JB92DRAFT_3120569 [Gautieria morchelliformis]|nr:hypothetical protein JB92DRAFT_3120569 [Gautieria morchelliformis]